MGRQQNGAHGAATVTNVNTANGCFRSHYLDSRLSAHPPNEPWSGPSIGNTRRGSPHGRSNVFAIVGALDLRGAIL